MTMPAPRLPLTLKESSRLYWELSRRGAFSSGEKFPWRYDALNFEEFLCLAILQSRYDPRALAILTDFLSRFQKDLNPIAFKNILRHHDALPLVAVIGEFVLASHPPAAVAEMFHYLMTDVSPVPMQLYFRQLYPIAGHKMNEASSKSLWSFKKWGFLAADAPFLKEKIPGGRLYLFDQDSRLRILHDLAAKKRTFRLKDYLEAIHHSVSRQQALKDVRGLAVLRKKGKQKGTVYAFND